MSEFIAAGEAMEKYLLGWVREQVGDGIAILKKERAFTQMPEAMRYVEGQQSQLKTKALSQTSDNRARKIVLETVSALTDVRPIWNYDTFVDEYKNQGQILNKLARGWWKNTQADRRLQSVLTYACVGGSGYAMLAWNPNLAGGGDLEMVPYDTRDVIPIEPVYSDSIQDWRGVILRKRLPLATIRAMYPAKAQQLMGKSGSWFGAIERETSGGLFSIATSAWSILSQGASRQEVSPMTSTDLLTIFVKDDSVNSSDQPYEMGDPGTNWAYTVLPGEKLYPRGRLIICTPEAILKDCPNPYWHGMFPVIRFTLDPLPWSLLGASMVGDIMPLQDALNEGLRGLEDGMAQWVRRGIIADKTAVPRSTLETIDTRRAGMKASVNPVAGEGFKILDGPVFPPWYMETIQYYKDEMDELTGVRGLQQLAQLKQMPAAETMEKYMDSLSPMLRIRARSIEVSLGELAEMLKVGFFQYYDTNRRMQILGLDGISLEDFDYDPGTLVPQGEPGEPRHARAEKHHKNFTFSVAPNSFLNVSHATQKMFILQLLRANLMDPWSAWETFDLANIGPAPGETIPDRIIAARKVGLLPGPTPEMVQVQEAMAKIQLMAAQMQLGQAAFMGMTGQGPGGGGSGGGGAIPKPPDNSVPISGTGPEGGRPPSGQEPPRFAQRDGGARTVVSESGA